MLAVAEVLGLERGGYQNVGKDKAEVLVHGYWCQAGSEEYFASISNF
jgi:hypothetical protein